MEKVLKAATLFQKAEVLSKRGEWAQAEILATQAADLDSEQAEYGALRAWIVAKSVAANAVRMKRMILTRATGTPMLRAAFGSPPTANTQCPGKLIA
mgnify:CR=1 FL=1